jgi:HAD superfamily phosphatase (TIGR01668 family)
MLNLQPDYLVKGSILKLSIQTLLSDGIRGLILDLDNTIMKPKAALFEADILEWLAEAKRAGLKMIIVTNNKNEKYLSSFDKALAELDLPMIIKAKKPRRTKLNEALKILDLPAEQVCVIGDRVLTDVWGGNRIKCKTAFVRPLLGKEEILLFRFLRKIEKLFLHPSHWD